MEGKSHDTLDGIQINMPYTTKLSFAPLLRQWESKRDSTDLAEQLLAREIMTRVEATPAFRKPIEDLSILEKHHDFVELLLAGLFPLNLRDTQLGKASKPFNLNAFYVTPAARKMMQSSNVKVKIEKSDDFFAKMITVHACAIILNQCYGQSLEADPLVIFTAEPEG